MIEGSRAIGVEARISGEKRIFRTRREVLLCAGTLLSPTMLMRSDIGPGAELAAHGIEVQADLPGLGQNLREHNSASLATFVNIPTLTADLGPLKVLCHFLVYILFPRS